MPTALLFRTLLLPPLPLCAKLSDDAPHPSTSRGLCAPALPYIMQQDVGGRQHQAVGLFQSPVLLNENFVGDSPTPKAQSYHGRLFCWVLLACGRDREAGSDTPARLNNSGFGSYTGGIVIKPTP